ncbi:MAG: ribosome maturation factor RimP [Deltaproteobacteria bacterium]|nr:ribosome maturation factor RimP [Deltaproteobacteria bacterium]
MRDMEITKKVRDLITKEVSIMGLELIDVTFGSGLLRLIIDRPAGVTLDDCVAVSKRVSILLDAEDPIPMHYRLEVSSPGLNRRLTKPQDFEHFAGKPIKVNTTDTTYRGKLKGLLGEDILLDVNDTQVLVKMQDVIKAKLDFDL